MKKTITLITLLMVITMFTTLHAQDGNSVPDFTKTERKEVPTEFTWNVADIFPNKEAWTAAKEAFVKKMSKIEAMAPDWTSAPDKMLALMKLMDELGIAGRQLYSYASLQSDMDMSNGEYVQMKGEMRGLFVQLGSKAAFINNDVMELGKAKFDEYVKAEPGLKVYAFGIYDTLRMKEHILPTDQQIIASQTGLFSGAASQAAGVLNDMEMPAPEVTLSDGTKVALNYINYTRYRGAKNPKDRELVMRTFWNHHAKFENTLAVLLDAGIQKDFFNASIRKYKDCLEARLFPTNIDTKVYYNLVDSVKANLAPLHRYLKIKKALLGLDTYRYDDVYASSVKAVDKTYTWDEAVKMVVDSLQPLGEEYLAPLKKAFAERWVDRYPNKGKATGAYSSGIYGVHPYVKMNFTGDYDNVSTLAHELGHAMHSYFSSKTQPYNVSSYTTFLAEMASTFNENMLMDYLLANENDDMLKLYLIDNYLERCRATIYRQTLFADFELAMHKEVEAGRSLTPAFLNKTYLHLTRLYYGHDKGICQVDEYIQNEWSSIPHFFMNYYVHSYSTGIIASMALSEMVAKGGEAERRKYITFLSAGGSDYSLNILKRAGVDMTTPAPYEAAFKRFDYYVGQMEEIIARLKKAGRL